jgi:hypothetical protein
MKLDELERLALAVKNGPPRILINDIDKAYIAALSPDVVLKLLAVAKAAVEVFRHPDQPLPYAGLRHAVDALKETP